MDLLPCPRHECCTAGIAWGAPGLLFHAELSSTLCLERRKRGALRVLSKAPTGASSSERSGISLLRKEGDDVGEERWEERCAQVR